MERGGTSEKPLTLSITPKVEGLQVQKIWLRGVDSNHDSQIQSLESYQLDDPGAGGTSFLVYFRLANTPKAHGHKINYLPFAICAKFLGARHMHTAKNSAKVARLSLAVERCPSGLRSTLGKRV